MRGSRNFRQGGPGQSDKKSSDVCFFFSPQLILQKSNGQFQRNLSFFKVPEGVQHFPGGSNFFQGGGSNCLFPIETHITCDFPRGGPDPLSPPPPPPGSALVKMHLDASCDFLSLLVTSCSFLTLFRETGSTGFYFGPQNQLRDGDQTVTNARKWLRVQELPGR